MSASAPAGFAGSVLTIPCESVDVNVPVGVRGRAAGRCGACFITQDRPATDQRRTVAGAANEVRSSPARRALASRDDDGARVVGLSRHCVSLDVRPEVVRSDERKETDKNQYRNGTQDHDECVANRRATSRLANIVAQSTFGFGW